MRRLGRAARAKARGATSQPFKRIGRGWYSFIAQKGEGGRAMRNSKLALLLMAFSAASVTPARAEDSAEAAKIKAWLQSYDQAFNAKDLDRLAAFYHPDVTIFEGGSVNNGWADYRDNHLGPELKEFQNLQFSLSNIRPYLLADGKSAYVTAEYSLKARLKERDIDAEGLETLVLLKGGNGAWKIRHSHTSSRRRPAAQAPTKTP